MLPAHQLQGELAIPVHTYMQSCPHTHVPGGANIRTSSCPKVPCAVIAVASVGPLLPGHCFATLGFKYFVLPKALKLYKKLQKCQKLLANLGSEDSVGRPQNYQLQFNGTVFRTKRSANVSRPQVKHFLGYKKSTKSNTCGSLFTRSGALLF